MSSSNWGDYSVTVPLTDRDQIDVVFTNDYSVNGQDRNLYVDYIQVNGVTYQENVAIIDRGGGNRRSMAMISCLAPTSTGVVHCALSLVPLMVKRARPWAITRTAT